MSLTKIISETPQISYDKDQKVAMVDKHKLRNLEVEDVSKNIVVIRQPEDSMLLPEGFTLVYFMDSEESAQKMGRGELDYIIIPQGSSMFGRETPFEKAFKQKGKEGIEHILGFIQGHTNEEEIFVDFMRVRHKYKRNSINSKMIKALEREFPNAEVTFSKPTDQGKKFIKKQYPKSMDESIKVNLTLEYESNQWSGIAYHGNTIDPSYENAVDSFKSQFKDFGAVWFSKDEEFAKEFADKYYQEDSDNEIKVIFKCRVALNNYVDIDYATYQEIITSNSSDRLSDYIPALKHLKYDGYITEGDLNGNPYDDIAVFNPEQCIEPLKGKVFMDGEWSKWISVDDLERIIYIGKFTEL